MALYPSGAFRSWADLAVHPGTYGQAASVSLLLQRP